MTLQPISKAAYDQFMGMDDDELGLVLSALAYDTIGPYISANVIGIQKSVDQWVAKRTEAIANYAKRSYISKSQNGEDTEHLEQLYSIAKAAWNRQDHPFGGNPENRGQFSTNWGSGVNAPGNAGYGQGKSTITFASIRGAKPIGDPGKAGLPTGLTSHSGDKKGTAKLTPEGAAKMQAAYMQLRSHLESYNQAGLGGDVKVAINGRKGTKVVTGSEIESAFNEMAKEGNVPKTADVSLMHATVGGAYFDALSAIPGYGNSPDRVMGNMTGVMNLPNNPEFAGQWWSDKYALSDNEPRFRRLKAGSELVDSFVPKTAIKTKAALAGAKYVGELGPDAEKLVGPTARKLSYRSRGTERKIDEALNGIDVTDRARAITGYNQPVLRGGKARQEGEPGSIPRYFIDRLPNKDFWELQRKSGAVPPSEGVVIDSAGKIVSQSVGFKDDHYLPFNIKALGKLRGGEYVRTRSTGGPTTEDIYTSLISGANGFTVVSRSGIFSVKYDDTFKGRRRYNDKAAKMVERYGKLLDAAGSGEVTLQDVDPDRYAEIAEGAKEVTNNFTDYKHVLDARIDEEKFKPRASEKMKAEIHELARAQLQDEIRNGGTPFARRYDEVKARSYADAKTARQLALDLGSPFNAEASDPVRATAEFLNDEIEARSNQMIREELGKRSFRAMQLDARGYNAALSALKEQYPYYIADINFRPLSPERDRGYVKPKFLRPDEVWEGYFDPDVKGSSENAGGGKLNRLMTTATRQEGAHGKIPASRSNYANLRLLQQRDVQEKIEQGATPKEKPKVNTPASAAAGMQRNADPRMAKAIAAYQAYLGIHETDKDGNKVPIQSNAITELKLDSYDLEGDLKRRQIENPMFLDSFMGMLGDHANSVGEAVQRGQKLNADKARDLRDIVADYRRSTTPRMELPEGEVGIAALDKIDAVFDFPEYRNFSESDIREQLKSPRVVTAAKKVNENTTPSPGFGTRIDERMKQLRTEIEEEGKNVPEGVNETPVLREIIDEAEALARLKSLHSIYEELPTSPEHMINAEGVIQTKAIKP